MSSKRTTRCLDYLVHSQSLCDITDLMTWDAMATQSAIALEVAAWHELLDDVDDLQSRLHTFVALCGQPHLGEAAA